MEKKGLRQLDIERKSNKALSFDGASVLLEYPSALTEHRSFSLLI
jgi:hypothetical protein